jgi:hypothetical protein
MALIFACYLPQGRPYFEVLRCEYAEIAGSGF